MTKFSKLPRKQKIKKLDALARRYIRLRDGLKCLACGTYYGMYWNGTIWQIPNGLQTCHIISRRHLNTRWHDRNMVSLCHGHHRIFDMPHERAFREDIFQAFGMDAEEYERLYWLSKRPFHGDYEIEYIRLKQLLDTIDETQYYA